jgi:hypothetical protein
VRGLAGLSKNQRRILEMLEIKPDMTTKEIAEMIFGRIVEYKSKEYASIYRSLVSIEKQGYIQRVCARSYAGKTHELIFKLLYLKNINWRLDFASKAILMRQTYNISGRGFP